MPKKPNPYTDKGEVNYGWLKLDFKEYNFVKQNDVYITIVHCDNCE